ncbi:ABC transporter substrate-binding protein [Natronorubrum halophilum]|uniref:ABC transporter substrate-binding protein n=1 Tax=Natronorubrum halophilum TaxID=1702106 RepID=UPI000EF6922E|nr:ABC transporter substrate-binding protein [Natronorubrum halophilum]
MPNINRRVFLATAGASASLAIAGCTGTDSGSGDTTTLNVGQALSPVHFDPIEQFSNPDAIVGNRIYSSIYTYTEGYDVEPELATAAPEIERDNTRYTIELRDDAQFHNGDPVTAEDVAYSITAPVEEGTPLASLFSPIDTTELIDENTIQIDLENPFAMFEEVLTHHVVPKAVREADSEAFGTSEPIGSGPFQFVDWEEGDYVELERWDDYWGDELPELERVRFEPIGESTTRITEIETGAKDVIETVPPQLWSTVEGMDDTTIHESPSVGYFYVAFNCNEGPTADVRVREAIDYTFSMDQAVERYIEPAGERQYSPMPTGLAEEWDMPVDEWAEIPHDTDMDMAQELFDEAGVPDDWVATILVPPDDNREEIGLTIANGIQEAGYDANVERLEWGALLDRAYTGNADDYNIYVLGWIRYADPDDFMFNLFHEEAEEVNQGVFYRDPDVQDQIAQARETVDVDRRRELYIDAITTLLEERVHLPSYNYYNVYAAKNYVKEFQTHPIGPVNPRLLTSYNNVYLE